MFYEYVLEKSSLTFRLLTSTFLVRMGFGPGTLPKR